jgi:hypothetical protein
MQPDETLIAHALEGLVRRAGADWAAALPR